MVKRATRRVKFSTVNVLTERVVHENLRSPTLILVASAWILGDKAARERGVRITHCPRPPDADDDACRSNPEKVASFPGRLWEQSGHSFSSTPVLSN